MDKKKFVLDCDPGSDDAIAIMLALYSEKLQLLGITTVNGNRIVPKTTENALRLIEFLKSDVTCVVAVSLVSLRLCVWLSLVHWLKSIRKTRRVSVQKAL